jgi:adenosine 3'-phospho 5'-phosphosulfate transporter B3
MAIQNEQPNAKEKIDFLCFNLAALPRSLQFITLTTLTFSFFLFHGYLQEVLFILPGFGDFPWFLTLVQFFFYALLAFIESILRNERQRKIPIKSYFILSFLTVSTTGFSYQAMPFLNYPTQLMFKSCKLIPVLIGGILIQGKRFNVYDVSATIMMTFGLMFFTLADMQVQPTFEFLGKQYKTNV